jgi:hypothetical protein
LWKIPVIESDKGFDSMSEEFVDEVVIEIQAARVWPPDAIRKNTGPADREPV